MTANERTLKIAVLISGTGRSLANLLSRIKSRELRAEVTAVVSSKPNVRGLEIAREAGLPDFTVARKGFSSVDAFSADIARVVDPTGPDLIVMAGFLSLFRLPTHWRGRVINIHPSLLPLFGGKGFYGHHVHEAVLAAGVAVSGCTVHFVDDEFDKGPIILQATCPVSPFDDADRLAARVFERECVALPTAIDWIRRGWVKNDEGQVVFDRAVETTILSNATI